MQTDGNLLLYNEPFPTDGGSNLWDFGGSNDPFLIHWSLGAIQDPGEPSSKHGYLGQRIVPGSSLVVTDNDVHVMAPDSSLVWAAFQYAAPLVTGQSIVLEGTRIVSPDGAGELVLNGGTLAARVNGTTVWSIGDVRHAVIQSDGSFVAYNRYFNATVSFGGAAPGPSIVWLSDRGRFALVAPDPGREILYTFG